MKVSVILTTHGEGKYLPQAIASVLAQTFQDYELWVAWDGPVTSAGMFLDDRIHYASNHNISSLNRYACTINRTFPKTQGEYITYLCHDDLYLPWRLEAFAHALDSRPEVNVVYGKEIFMVETNGSKDFNTEFLTLHGVTRQPAGRINHNSVMHRRECFEKVGGWDEQSHGRYGDAAFFNRLAEHWDFYPIDQWQPNPAVQFGEVFRLGEQNGWTGKP